MKKGEVKNLVQVQSLISREIEIQRLKKIYIMIILMYLTDTIRWDSLLHGHFIESDYNS